MNELYIRNTEPSDYQPIIRVVNDWWGGRQMSDMLPKLFFVHFQNTSFVAEQDGEMVAFLVGFVSQTFPDEAYIHFVGVSPMFRKAGLARALYEKFFVTVQKMGCRTVRCVTSTVNKDSIAFHLRLGFSAKESDKVIDGISVFEGYDGEGQDRVLLYKHLDNRENAMQEMIAYCGLVCTSCPQFIATKNDDDIAREEAAKRIAEKFGLSFKPEEINCDGCLSSGGRLIGFCNTCEIRKCGITKSVENCSTCDEQPCDKLNKFHEFSPDARASFEALLRKKR